VNDLRPATLPALAGALGLVYVAWLAYGTRANPPMSYRRFRTGLTFPVVREILGFEQDAAYEAGQYMFVSRSTVLGRMHEMKEAQYARYLESYRDGDEDLPF